MNDFTLNAINLIKSIPPGKVATYGQIALMAGDPRGARQVARLLHSMSRKYDLPWHRVINSQGESSLPPGLGSEEQLALLAEEGVQIDINGRIDLDSFLWQGE